MKRWNWGLLNMAVVLALFAVGALGCGEGGCDMGGGTGQKNSGSK